MHVHKPHITTTPYLDGPLPLLLARLLLRAHPPEPLLLLGRLVQVVQV